MLEERSKRQPDKSLVNVVKKEMAKYGARCCSCC